MWLALIAFTLVMLALKTRAEWLFVLPKDGVVPFTTGLNDGMNWFIDGFGFIFRAISQLLSIPLGWVVVLLHWVPWPTIVVIVGAAAWRASGPKLTLFAVLALAYMVVVGYWDKSMNSLSLVIISVPLAILVGFIFGVAGYFSPRAERFILPMLDLLQTIPAFAYLLPILLLFGFGPVVGLIASLLFAFPPMVRNTMLGLRRVSAEVTESGLMSGATTWQLFWQVQVPSALRQLLLGVNQSMMASFSMIIIASIIGGTSDIGWEVITYLRKADFGVCLLAGIVIALLAMVMDRISYGLAMREETYFTEEPTFIKRNPELVIGGGLAVFFLIVAQVVPWLKDWPEGWTYFPAKFLNQGIDSFVLNFSAPIGTIKTLAYFYVMKPIGLGLTQVVSPYTWGFELTQPLRWGYAAVIAAGMIVLLWLDRQKLAVVVGLFGVIFFFGFTNLPWAAQIGAVTLLGWQLGRCAARHRLVPRHDLHAARRHLAGGHDLDLPVRHRRGAGVRAGRRARHLGLLERPRVGHPEADQRHAADHAAVRLPHPVRDDLQDRRLHRPSRHHRLCLRAGGALYRARACATCRPT